MKNIHFLFFAFILASLALALCPDMVTAQDQSGKVYFEQGEAEYNAKNFPPALKKFRKAADLDPSLSAEVFLYFGRIFIQQKKWRVATKSLLWAKKTGLSKEGMRKANIALAYIMAYKDFAGHTTSTKKKNWTTHISLSEEWVGNLVRPLTVTTASSPERKSDFRTKTAIGFDYYFPVSQKDKFTAGYDFFQSLYADFTNLNLQSHKASGRYSHKATKDVNLSADIGFTHNRLNGNEYLNSFNVGPSVFFHEWGSFFGRAGYNYENFDYKLNPEQDSDVHTVSITQYYFLSNKKGFVSAGYAYAEANSHLKRWDYDRNKGFISGKYELDRKNRINGFISYSSTDYQGYDTLKTTKKRQDDIFSFKAKYTYKFKDWSDIFVQYSLLDTNSNLTRQDYTRNTISVGTALKW